MSVEDLVGVWCDLVLALSGPGADLVDLVLDLVVIWCFWCMYGITSGGDLVPVCVDGVVVVAVPI